MQRSTLLVFAAFLMGAANIEAQGLLDTVITADKAVPTVNQTLEGTWIAELRPPGLPAGAPAIPNLSTFGADGTLIATGSDGTQSSAHGIWLRVGDRKFLETVFVFAFDGNRALTTITKIRVNIQLSLDGRTFKGTNEIVVMDRTGKVMATIPGGTTSGVRLSPEIPGDFYDFQKLP
ncbi:MAG: hypothetical protein ABI759_16015 [Candidatus Solibacter sp.]